MAYDTNGDTSRRNVLRGIAGATAAVAAGAASTGSATASAGEPVALQYFHEDWATITADLSRVASVGFDAIWIQQSAEAKLSTDDPAGRNDPPLGYQPVDLRNFDSALGTETELQTLIDTAHDNAVEVYLDTVMNHMATGQTPTYDFPQFSYRDFHHYGGLSDYKDPYEVKNGELLGLPDLDQDSSYVRSQLKQYMEKMAELGADGYRFDAVKHMPERFFGNYANKWAEELGMFRVGEVLDGRVDYVQNYVDQGPGMHAFDYPLYFVLMRVFDDEAENADMDMQRLEGAGLVAQDPYHAMPFVDNHDQDAPKQYELAHAHVLTLEGFPVVYNLYPDWLLSNDNIVNMVWVKRNLAGGSTVWRHTDPDLAVYEREGNLLVGLNNGGQSRSKWVETSWANQELKDYSGTGDRITTNDDGWVELTVPAEDWVFYAPPGQGDPIDGSSSDDSTSDDSASDGSTSDRSSDDSTSEDSTSDDSSSDGSTSDGTTSDDSTSEDSTSDGSTSDGSSSDDSTSDDAAGGGSSSGCTVPIETDTTYIVRNTASGKALEVSDAATDDGADVQQWAYGGGQNQQWRVEKTDDGYVKLLARHSEKALDVTGGSTAESANIQQWRYVGGESQQWNVTATGSGLKLTARHSGKVLSVAGAATDDGATVTQTTDAGSAHQRWAFEPLDSAESAESVDVEAGQAYVLRNNASGKVLNVAGASRDNGADVEQWAYAGGRNQQWRVAPSEDGYYRLLAVHSGKALDVYAKSQEDGANVHQYVYYAGDHQQWAIRPTDDGVKLVARHSDKILEVADPDAGDGATVQQNEDTGAPRQRWTLERP